MDFLRKVALFQGRVLFVESDEDWTSTAALQKNPGQGSLLVRESMLMCLAAIY